MSMFKRLSATLVTRLDRVVDELEDHDAVVNAALNDLQRKVAEAKVRYGRVTREREALQETIVSTGEKVNLWRRRAVQCGDENREKALECVARARQQELAISRLEKQESTYSEAAEKLEAAIATLEQRVSALRQKQVVMRARESTGKALSTAVSEPWNSNMLDDVLDRWEMKVIETELTTVVDPPGDKLESAFAEDELRSDLEQELNVLLEKEGHHGR